MIKFFSRAFFFFLFFLLQTVAFRSAFFFEPHYLYFGGGVLLFSDIALYALFPKKLPRGEFLALSTPSLLLTAFAFAIGLVIEIESLKNILVLFHAFLQGVYLVNAYLYFYRTRAYQERSLWHITVIMNLVTVFFATSTLFATSYFLSISILFTIGAYILLIFGLLTQTCVFHRIPFREHWFFSLVTCSAMASLVLSLAWLPTIYYVNAIFATACYYFFSNLGISTLRKEISIREIRLSVSIVIIVILLLVGTIQWR